MTQTATAHGWQLEEDSATAYERFLVPLLFDTSARDLLDRLHVRSGDRVLDVACGTGAVARHAAQRVEPDGEVVAVDLSPGMLAAAKEAAASRSIRWEEASADALPLEDGHVDVVCCQQGLQFFGDRPAALAEMHRVTTPGGRLGVSVCRPLEHQPGYRPLVDGLRRHVGQAAAEGMASPFGFGDRDEVVEVVRAAGFQDVEARIVIWPLRISSPTAFLRGETASSPLGGVIAELDDEVIDALIADISEGSRPHTDDAGLSFPIETLVVTAVR
jgi:ubiquinone/menaquinone biosynthesis C-methylase UbiE